jgi:DNA polymerase-3 subunit gamma/tau
MDVIELDGAAHGKVEHITALIDGANWGPSQLKRKVYIIDECHRLSGSAVSALLKITEAPPSYLTFIFCTTDPDKVIDTITSRSQRFNFRRLLSKEIVGRLRYISDKEKVNVTDEALFVLAQKSRGSMRDAVVALEQIATLAGQKEITGKHAQKYFGMADRQIVFQIVEAMVSSNIPLVMDQVNDLIMSNVDTKEIAFEISEAYRNIMLLKANNGDCKWLDLPEQELELLKKNGENIKLGQLDKLAKQFSTLRKELEFSINERWVLESTLIHCTALLRK